MNGMRCFVINLKRSVKRREYVLKHLGELGIAFEFFDAIDGRALSEEYVRNACSEDMSLGVLGRKLSLGEIGCALSHTHIYKKIVEEAIPVAVILEDDCEIVERDKFKDMMRMSSEDIHPFNLLLLYHNYFNRKGLSMHVKYFGKLRLSNGLEIAKPIEAFSRTVGYMITQAGVRLMLENVFPLRRTMDSYTAYSEMYGLTLGILSDALVVPNHRFESDIWKVKDGEISEQIRTQVGRTAEEAIHCNKWISSVKRVLYKSDLGYRIYGMSRWLLGSVFYFFLRLGVWKWYKFHSTTSTGK